MKRQTVYQIRKQCHLSQIMAAADPMDTAITRSAGRVVARKVDLAVCYKKGHRPIDLDNSRIQTNITSQHNTTQSIQHHLLLTHPSFVTAIPNRTL